ncbi:Lrp/AsnC family transcriptional regulator [Rhizobium beringeri]
MKVRARMFLPRSSKLLRDPVNLEILQALVEQPRLSTSELSRRVGMSAPAVRERVQRLEEAGIIRGYQTQLDPRALGYEITVFVRVKPMPGKGAAGRRACPRNSERCRVSSDYRRRLLHPQGPSAQP